MNEDQSRFLLVQTNSLATRAAQYVRMSTEHQKYSIENQAEAISDYADTRGYRVIRTYEDRGKSGITFEHRDGLRQLIRDIESKEADYSVVLIYDVSRWGRFQDPDESAFYEYRCRRAGVRVEYIAEGFRNDGTIGSDLHKVIKRRMAAEYSRELSVKCFHGQRRVVELGYRAGGAAGYGLRRLLVDEHGSPKQILEKGQRKSIQADRVILVPGPLDEIAVVRWMYGIYAHGYLNQTEIAQELNAQNVLSPGRRPWTHDAVRSVLTNEKYIGNNVWNIRSAKLGKARTFNEPNRFVRRDSVFEPLIEPKLFQMVHSRLFAAKFLLTDSNVLERLREVLRERGRLSTEIIDQSGGRANSSALHRRFRGVVKAYRLIGYEPDHDYAYMEDYYRLRRIRRSLIEQIAQAMRSRGASVRHSLRCRWIELDGFFSVRLVLSSKLRMIDSGRAWRVFLPRAGQCDLVVAACLNSEGDETATLFYMRRAEVRNKLQMNIREAHPPKGVLLAESSTVLFEKIAAALAVAKPRERSTW